MMPEVKIFTYRTGVYSPVNHDDEFDGILVRFKGRMIIKSKDAYPYFRYFNDSMIF